MRVKHSLPPRSRDPSQKLDDIDWNNAEEVAALKWLCEQSTPEGLSALARHVLGYDSFRLMENDKGRQTNGDLTRNGRWKWRGGVFRTAGIVAWGPHREMLSVLSAPGDKILFASRDAYKTTCAIVKVVQLIITNRDTRGIIYMETGKLAEKTVRKVRRCLEMDRVIELWGDFRGDSDNWTNSSFTVCGRSLDDRVSTVAAAGTDVATVGDHVDWIWVDDPLSPLSSRSPTMVDRVVEGWRELTPLMDPGAFEMITLTPYVRGDVADHAVEQFQDSYQIARQPCGMKAYYDPNGKIQVQGHPRFVHLSEAYLLKMARKMGVPSFNRSYALSIEDDTNQVFRREDLLPAEPESRFRNLSAYLLVDTATSDAANACMSVLTLVAMDWDDTAYVVDIRIGRWLPNQLQAEFCNLYLRWQSEYRICGVAIEGVTLNRAFRSGWENELRRQGISVHWIELNRSEVSGAVNGQGITKSQRILALESRVRSHRLRFLPSVPRTCTLNGRTEILYDPQGFLDGTGQRLPAGEVVDQFVKWRPTKGYKGLQDIPDALAALDEMSRDGSRRMVPPSSRQAAIAVPQMRAEVVRQRQQTRRDILSRVRGN